MTTQTKTYSKPRPLNARQRQFVINYASGMTQSEAYIQAGYSVDPKLGSASDCASRLMTSNASVKDYYTSLLERQESLALVEGVEKLLSKSEKRQILATFARAQLADLLDDNGQVKLDKNSPAMKALKEYSSRTKLDKEGNPIVNKYIKMLDPLAAIQEDNKMSGDYAPSRHQVAKAVQINVSVVDKTRKDKTPLELDTTTSSDILLLEDDTHDIT